MDEMTIRVEDLMTRKVTSLDCNDRLDLADDIMELGRFRHIPVLDGGKVVGVVSQRDLFRSALAFALGYGERAKRSLLRSLCVKDVMSQPVVTAERGMTIGDAARLMLRKKIGCLPVVENGGLVGVLTETDILRHVIEVEAGGLGAAGRARSTAARL